MQPDFVLSTVCEDGTAKLDACNDGYRRTTATGTAFAHGRSMSPDGTAWPNEARPEPAVVSEGESSTGHPKLRYAAPIVGSAFVVAVVRHAWISDDAFIDFRVVWNVVHGHGLVSNPGTRVQGFTNPLWTLILTLGYSFFRNMYWVTTLASIACTTWLAALLCQRRHPASIAVLVPALLLGSRSFVEFSSSGLENPLAHLLLGALALSQLSNRRSALTWCLAGMVALNRLDHLLLILPALVVLARADGWRVSAKRAVWAFSPLVAWLLFATVYYGFPFPNTAYAKLNTELPRAALLSQGFAYIVDVFLRDPLIPLVGLGAAVLVFVSPSRERTAIPLLAGVALYLAFVIAIGGDFMAGRFLTAPYLLAALVAGASLRNARGLTLPGLVAGALLYGRWAFETLPVDPTTECGKPLSGIVSERACYVEHTGIAQNVRTRKFEQHPYFKNGLEWKHAGTDVVTTTLIGLAGYAAGPRVHLVDEYALTDALLARIRFKTNGDWRIGHFSRGIPEGYLESLKTGRNELRDPCLHALYSDLDLVTRRPTWTPGRLAAILRLNVTRRTCPAPG